MSSASLISADGNIVSSPDIAKRSAEGGGGVQIFGIVEAGRINVCVGDCSLGSIVVDKLGGCRGLNEAKKKRTLKA